MPDINLREFERMRNGGARTSVRVQPAGTAVSGYQVPLGNRPSLRDIGVVGAPTWGAEQTETWVRTSVSATCPRRLVVFEGGKRDIDRCMEFGDDFDGAALNTWKWTNTGAGYTISGGAITLTNTTSTIRTLTSTGAFETNCAIRIRKSTTISGTTVYAQTGFQSSGSATALSDIFRNVGVNHDALYSSSGSGNLNATEFSYDSNPHTYDLIRNGTTSLKLLRDGVLGPTNATEMPTGALPVYLMVLAASSGSASIVIDWVVVRKYVAAEPVAGTAQPSALNRSMCQSLNLADGLRACCA